MCEKIHEIFKDFQPDLDAEHNRDYFRTKRQLLKWKGFKRVEFIDPPSPTLLIRKKNIPSEENKDEKPRLLLL